VLNILLGMLGAVGAVPQWLSSVVWPAPDTDLERSRTAADGEKVTLTLTFARDPPGVGTDTGSGTGAMEVKWVADGCGELIGNAGPQVFEGGRTAQVTVFASEATTTDALLQLFH